MYTLFILLFILVYLLGIVNIARRVSACKYLMTLRHSETPSKVGS